MTPPNPLRGKGGFTPEVAEAGGVLVHPPGPVDRVLERPTPQPVPTRPPRRPSWVRLLQLHMGALLVQLHRHKLSQRDAAIVLEIIELKDPQTA